MSPSSVQKKKHTHTHTHTHTHIHTHTNQLKHKKKSRDKLKKKKEEEESVQERDGGWGGLLELGGGMGHWTYFWSRIKQQGKGRRIFMDGAFGNFGNFLIFIS